MGKHFFLEKFVHFFWLLLKSEMPNTFLNVQMSEM